MKQVFTILVFIGIFHFATTQEKFTLPAFFRTTRVLPLVELNTKQEIKVSDYGAQIDDGNNDICGITNAINAAKTLSGPNKAVKVLFEKGVYDLIPITGNSHSITITGARYLLIEGNGAEIMLHNPELGFLSLTQCQNVIVQNLYVDYATLPFTRGKVISTNVSNATFDLRIDDGFPLLGVAYFTSAPEKWGVLKEESDQLKPGVTNLFPYVGWTKISSNTFRVKQPNASYIIQIEVGDYFVQIACNNGKTISLIVL